MSFNYKFIFPFLVIAVIFYFSVFTVNQWQQALVFKFREIQRSNNEPGIHFMIPLVNYAQKIEKRLLNLDKEPQRFLTKEKKDVIVDYYVKWRITDIEKFYTATRGNLVSANTLLEQRINRALRDQFGERTIQEVVSGERTQIMSVVTSTTSNLSDELGISVIDVRTKRIDLPAEVSNSVYQRMRAERDRVAKGFRARGAEAAERIRANADREREVILANAYRDAETIRGEGDAQATEVYAAAFTKDREFYSFYRSLNAYQNSFNQGNDIILVEPKSDFFKYFNKSK
jgi:membrane protease subunit HflC